MAQIYQVAVESYPVFVLSYSTQPKHPKTFVALRAIGPESGTSVWSLSVRQDRKPVATLERRSSKPNHIFDWRKLLRLALGGLAPLI
jgi:hypothetical protein